MLQIAGSEDEESIVEIETPQPTPGMFNHHGHHGCVSAVRCRAEVT